MGDKIWFTAGFDWIKPRNDENDKANQNKVHMLASTSSG